MKDSVFKVEVWWFKGNTGTELNIADVRLINNYWFWLIIFSVGDWGKTYVFVTKLSTGSCFGP